MGLLSKALGIEGLAKQGIDLVDQFVEDKDKANELRSIIEQMHEHSYQIALGTKTIPWVDAFHKMGRQLLAWGYLIDGTILLFHNPNIDFRTLALICAPGAIYNLVKGKGK